MDGIATCSPTQHMCNCRGPQNGEPACPCAMNQQRRFESAIVGVIAAHFSPSAPRAEDYDWVARELGDVEPRYSADMVARASLAGLSVESMFPVED